MHHMLNMGPENTPIMLI